MGQAKVAKEVRLGVPVGDVYAPQAGCLEKPFD